MEQSNPLVARCRHCGADIADKCFGTLLPIPFIETDEAGNQIMGIRSVPVVMAPLKCPECHKYMITLAEKSKVAVPRLVIPRG